MWKIIDKTRKVFDRTFEYIAFTNDEAVINAIKDSKNHEIVKLNYSIESLRYELFVKGVYYEHKIPCMNNVTLKFRLALHFSNYQLVKYYRCAKYSIREISKEDDLINPNTSYFC